MSRTIISYAATAAVTLAAAIAAAQTPWRIEHIGGWGGPVTEIERVGNIGFVATGQRLVSIDLSDPANPVELGGINLGGAIQDVKPNGDYVYVSVGPDAEVEFVAIDVSDPTAPDLVWDFGQNFTGSAGGEIHVYGDILYFSAVGGFVRLDTYVFDIGDTPGAPVFIKKIPFFLTVCADIVGSYIYAVPGDSGAFQINDISDPLNPVLVYGELLYDGMIQIAMEGQTAYILAEQSDREYLVVFDVSDPSAPQQVGSFAVTDLNQQETLGGLATDLDVRNGIVYMTVKPYGVDPDYHDESQGLVIVDATDPANITPLTKYKTRASVTGVRIDPVDPVRAYLFDQGEGLIVLDVSDPANPIRLGNFYSPGSMPDMARDGDLMYVSDRWNGFSILDVADPAEPTLVGVYQTREESIAGGNWGIDHHDGMVYLSTGYAGFEIVDVSDPTNPVFAGVLAGGWPQGNRAGDLKFNPALGDILHVVLDPGAWLRNFDVDDPGNVTEVGSAFLDGLQPFMRDIELTADGATAHVTRGAEVGAVDVTDPHAPEVVSMYFPPGQVSTRADVALHDDGQGGVVRYISGDSQTPPAFFAQDVSDPANPGDPVVFDENSGGGMAIGIGAGRIFHVRGNGSVRAWGIADRLEPVLLANSFEVVASKSNGGVGILVEDEIIFISDSWDSNKPAFDLDATGFVVLQMICPNDFNGDGALNILDFVTYQNAFVMQDPDADINGDGMLNILDFVAFQDIFLHGCP